MKLYKVDRCASGAQCSCSPYSSSRASFGGRQTRPHLKCKPCASTSARLVGSTTIYDIVELAEVTAEAETELLSREMLEAKFASGHNSQISSLQTLERLKCDLSTALQDLEDQESAFSFSESDWDKLNAARRQHALEESERNREAQKEKEQKKQERAIRKAARKAAAEASSKLGNSHSTDAPILSSRRQNQGLAESGRPRGAARAAAAYRTRTAGAWGKRHLGNAEERTFMNSLIQGSFQEFITVGNGSVVEYMKNMPQHTLLTAAEETQLSIKIKDWLFLDRHFQNLSKAMNRPPTMVEWAEEVGQDPVAFKERVKDASMARSRMLICNQRLVISIARRYQSRGMELADLIQEGMGGLVRSVEKFDHTKGFKFSTYATWWVRQSITRAIAELGKVIRLPVHLHELLIRIHREERDYFAKHQVWPAPELVGKALGISAAKVREIKQAAVEPKDLEEPVSKGDPEAGGTLGDRLEDCSQVGSAEMLVAASLERDLDAVLATLGKREHGILRMRYGLDDGQPRTLQEISHTFRVTRERIRQLENKAMAKLKDPQRHSCLRSYSDGDALAGSSDYGWKAAANRSSSH